MKLRTLVTFSLIFGILFGSVNVNAQGVSKSGGKTIVFDKQKFIDTINTNRLGAKNSSDGYAAVIIKGGNLVTEVAGGLAIRNGAGLVQVPMSTSTPNDIGSDMKLLSFITLLSEFEKRAAKNPALTVEKQLNQPIRAYLPKAWRAYVDMPPHDKKEEVNATIRAGQVTFAQLMSHKSGFRNLKVNKSSPFNYLVVGIQPQNIGKREYCNFNATVLTYILPRLVNPDRADQIEQEIEAGNIAQNDHSVYGKLYGDFFEQWMQQNVFNAITPSFRPSCDPAVEFAKTQPAIAFARYYTDPVSGASPQFWSEKSHNYGCHAQGGYYVSMRQLAAFMATFQATNVLVSEAVRKRMYDDTNETTQDNRLGWSRILFSPFAQKNFGANQIPYHGGDGVGHAAIVRLPGGYIAVGTINGPGSGGGIAIALKDAWGAAVADNFK